MALRVQFSPRAQQWLDGLTVEGRQHFEDELARWLEHRPWDHHVHAAGLCVLLEPREAEEVSVVDASPSCLLARRNPAFDRKE